MKRLPLNNPSFIYLGKSFAEHLDILGYSQASVNKFSVHIRELLYFLESEGLTTIRNLCPHHFKKHFEQLKQRTNLCYGGALRNNSLNQHLNAIRRFTAYLRGSGRLDIADPPIKNFENDTRSVIILTEEEISLLFKASYEPFESYRMPYQKVEALRARDRAMLAVYYGCGLRKSEGGRLRISDIDLDRNLIHVKKSKTGKERFVPLGKNVRKYIVDYLYDHRSVLIDQPSDNFFISTQGGRKVTSSALFIRLKYLQRRSRDPDLMQKDIGLHTLRHSIATHLLKAGMKIEMLARFLGHSTIDSTQIYTHIAGLNPEQKYNNIPIAIGTHYEPIQLHEDEL